METPLLSKRQFNKIRKFFPDKNNRPRIDDLLVISGIIFVIQNGLKWRQLPEFYGKWKTVYSRFRRWSKAGIFNKIFHAMAAKQGKSNDGMLDSTAVKAHRTAASMASGPREIGRSRGGLNTKIHLLCNIKAKPLDFIITGANIHDILPAPDFIKRNYYRLKTFMGDKAFDADYFRDLLAEYRITACIPPKSNRKQNIEYDRSLYKKRHVVENMFARLKDWRGIAMRYARCAHIFHSFICIALIILFF